MDEKNSYNVREVAQDFDVSRRTVERLIQRGELRSYNDKFGKRRISVCEIGDFKRRNQSIPKPDTGPRAKNV